jgi:hypothetical protein
LQFLEERLDADLFRSVYCKGLQHRDTANALILLRMRG